MLCVTYSSLVCGGSALADEEVVVGALEDLDFRRPLDDLERRFDALVPLLPVDALLVLPVVLDPLQPRGTSPAKKTPKKKRFIHRVYMTPRPSAKPFPPPKPCLEAPRRL